MLRGGLVLWVAVTLVFLALRAVPGDAISETAFSAGASQSDVEILREEMGLREPLHVQYLQYLGNLLQGDLGRSLVWYQPVTDLIGERLLPTLSLGLSALAMAVLWGVSLGIANSKQYPRWIFILSEGLIVLALSVPFYLTAILGLYIFSFYLDVLPAFGSETPLHLILPTATLGFHAAGSIARVLSSNLRETYQETFILAARAKGLPPIDLFYHAFRVAILPTLGVLALQAGFLLSGIVIIEEIFGRRGLGSLLLEAVLKQDYPLVQALTLFIALVYLLSNGLSALGRRVLDPRLRES